VGGKEAIKKHWKAATVSGLVLSLTALIIAGFRILPVEIIGIVAGFLTMLTVYFIYRDKKGKQKENKPSFSHDIFKACLPFILLVIISLIVNIPSIKMKLES
ncbi:MAG: L-lactate permease, partial [Thermodesulfovibrio sp.]|nr:L-lactate permease [Thermodesulfovibrio sp.]